MAKVIVVQQVVKFPVIFLDLGDLKLEVLEITFWVLEELMEREKL